jgi:hypothetical protein
MNLWSTALRACVLLASLATAHAQPAAATLHQDLATLNTGRAAGPDDPQTAQAARHVRAVAGIYGMTEAEAAQPVVTATGILRKVRPEVQLFELFDAATRIGTARQVKGREALVNALTQYIGARRAANTSHERAVELVLRPGQPA